MKTCFSVVSDVFALLDSSLDIPVYKNFLPAGAPGECALVRCGSIDAMQLQHAVVAVHLYVPAIAVAMDGTEDLLPDQLRFETLTATAISALADVDGSDFHLRLADAGHLEREGDTYYMALALDYYHGNL